MTDEKCDINTITNSGNIGAIAVGRGASAVQASGQASVNTAALDAQFAALEHVIGQHNDSSELKSLLKEAIQLAKSENPKACKPILEKIAQYGGAIGSIAGGIAGVMAL